VQTLLEWRDDFERARVLALLWRGDRYRLYADEWGDNLVWICHWLSPEAATLAGEILTPEPVDPAASEEPSRHRALIRDGTRTIFADCASGESLSAARIALAIPTSPPDASP
jgi:hypothetical protein